MIKPRASFDGKEPAPEGPEAPLATSTAILELLRSLEPISKEDQEEFERLIKEGKLPVNDRGIFDDG